MPKYGGKQNSSRECADIVHRKYYNLTRSTDKTPHQKEHLLKIVHFYIYIIVRPQEIAWKTTKQFYNIIWLIMAFGAFKKIKMRTLECVKNPPRLEIPFL